MNKTPASYSESPVRVGGAEKNARAAAVSSGLGDNGDIVGCESTGTTRINHNGSGFGLFSHEG